MANKKALFLKTKHIGDSIILTSAIEALPEEYLVDVLCFKESEAIFKMHPRVRNVFIIPRHLNGFAKLRHYQATLNTMRTSRYDLLAQFSDDWRGAFLARILNVPLSVGRASKKRPSFWSNSFKQISKTTLTKRPAAEQDVDLLRKVGLFNQVTAPPYFVDVPHEANARVEEWLKSNFAATSTQKMLLIHAPARWKFKGLPNSTWAELIDVLHERGWAVVLGGAPSDAAFNKELSIQCKRAPKIVDGFSIPESAALIKKSDLLVSIDSMSIHLASAVQTPVVAIFGPTDEKIWSPWQVEHRIVALSEDDSPSFACRPCGLDGCAGSKVSQCLMAVEAKRLLSAIDDLLGS
jgi:heptosyltransferase-3